MRKENSVYHLRKLVTAAAVWGEQDSQPRSEKLETEELKQEPGCQAFLGDMGWKDKVVILPHC